MEICGISCRCGSQRRHEGIAAVTTDVLQALADTWNRHDADALMSFMTDDCVFEASAGRDAVRAARASKSMGMICLAFGTVRSP